MMSNIHERIINVDSLRKGYVVRDGFVFSRLSNSPIFDCLVVRNPAEAVGASIHSPVAERSLKEHIKLIQEYELEKAIIICNDLSFINECPSLRQLAIYPALDAESGFDFSPLYQMPEICDLFCATSYGYKDQLHSSVDYSKIKGISCVYAAGIGQQGYESIPQLKKLWLSGSKRHHDFTTISCSNVLRDVTIIHCGIKSLSGIGKHIEMQHLALCYCRSLTEISSLKYLSKSLRSLTIECCPQVADFSVLEELRELEHLQLYGNNTIPNLHFLQGMKKLQTFCFTVNVLDGDLSLCRDVPYASCKNRKHYNYKDKDLPKALHSK